MVNSEHDNHVSFKNTELTWSEEGHSITDGQPYDGVTISGDDMNVHAGCH